MKSSGGRAFSFGNHCFKRGSKTFSAGAFVRRSLSAVCLFAADNAPPPPPVGIRSSYSAVTGKYTCCHALAGSADFFRWSVSRYPLHVMRRRGTGSVLVLIVSSDDKLTFPTPRAKLKPGIFVRCPVDLTRSVTYHKTREQNYNLRFCQ